MICTFENVSKTYYIGKIPVPALKQITLKLEEGEFVSLAGPSGSGKTTMLNLIGCLDKPTAGKVSVKKTDLADLSNNALADLRNQYIGFVFQYFNLIPVLTALENVEFPLLLRKNLSAKERKAKAIAMLEEVELGEFLHRHPNELSGGQQQRVVIARALVKNPEIVLADEPTANLDSETGKMILAIMQKMNEKHKTTFIFATHDPLVMDYARRLIKLHDGKIEDDINKS